MILQSIAWDVDPEIFSLGSFKLQYYGLLFVSGIALCFVCLKWIFKRESLSQDNLELLTMYGIFGIFIGARLGHCIFYEPSYYLANPLEILLPIQKGLDGGYSFTGFRGLASHGGTAGLIVALYFYVKKTKQPIMSTLDLIGIVAPLGAGFIRLANLMNSEIIGMPADVPWAFIFKRIDDIPRHPAQLYESICYFLIFGLHFFLYKKYGHRLKNGYFFGSAIALIYIARFFIEFVKERQVAFEEGLLLDMGQILSIPFVLIGLYFMIRSYKKSGQELSEN
ncbi:MAG: phosphatidylglycerol:prolipoprotein diacylglycerol transferase [Flavobacteriales bacterium]|jgi:phosphatidylglycerol:prolipoprotein diacylglycerol transferase